MTRITSKRKRDIQSSKPKRSPKKQLLNRLRLQPGIIKVSETGRVIHAFSGSMLWLCANPAPPAWLENAEPCVAYKNKFGVPISLPFWFINRISLARQLIEEALTKERRRWVAECGPWVSNPPITAFRGIIEAAGKSLDSLTFQETANIWLDPPEWIEPESKRDWK